MKYVENLLFQMILLSIVYISNNAILLYDVISFLLKDERMFSRYYNEVDIIVTFFCRTKYFLKMMPSLHGHLLNEGLSGRHFSLSSGLS